MSKRTQLGQGRPRIGRAVRRGLVVMDRLISESLFAESIPPNDRADLRRARRWLSAVREYWATDAPARASDDGTVSTETPRP